MRRIVHLSDLHFGSTSPRLLDPLVEEVARLSPDLVAISGDFTQRARPWQFAEARAFLDRITAPVLCVPGNHDTPLDNLFLRLFNPWGRYRRHIDPDLEPVFADAELLAVGVNTVNRFAWQQGRLSRRTLSRLLDAFGQDDGRCRIVVCHHPLEHLPGTAKAPTRGAGRALQALHHCGADIVLCGHVHTVHHAPFTAAPGVLFVQAGTGLSSRLRDQENSFNLLEIDRDEARLTAIAAGEAARFRPLETALFRQQAECWRRA
ncbi:MAG: metallophosphoesterase family protein [Paracoccaceae bacterium]